MFAHKKELRDYIERNIPFLKKYAQWECEIYVKIEKILEWVQKKPRGLCPFSSGEIREIADNLIEVNSFRCGGDSEKFQVSSDYRMGRMAAMGNMTGYVTEELIIELYGLAGMLEIQGA